MTKLLNADHHVLIIGGSHAGVAMAEQLRKQGFDGAITIIDREDTMPMERPPLSKAWLAETSDAEKSAGFLLRQVEWFAEHKVAFRSGVEVVSADAAAKTATLSTGNVLSWDQLVLATGAVPRALPASMFPSPLPSALAEKSLHVLRVPADAQRLSKSMEDAASMVVIGGGYIGLEVAASARKRGLDVTVIEMAPRLLARVASPDVSHYFQELHDVHGTRIMTSTTLRSIAASDGDQGLTLTVTTEHAAHGNDTSTLSADVVVVGIGVIPDIALAEGLGLDHGNGLLVDGDFHSNIIGVWAIGDVALAAEGYTQGAMRIESVHHAQMSAEIAAAAMMGVTPKPHEVPWFWSEQYDRKLQSAGLVPADADVVARPGKRDGAMSFWSFSGGVLTAIESISDPQAYMIGKTAISDGLAVTPEQIADPDFALKTLIGR
jgi:NADPH-dependent 2,4-dienoyl-CoA reductase/sulfur reductase-like enzyme